jgi:hypothetical protein
MGAFLGDVWDAVLPTLAVAALWAAGRFAKAVLKRLDQIAGLPAAVDRLGDELAAMRDNHEIRLTKLENHPAVLNGATP